MSNMGAVEWGALGAVILLLLALGGVLVRTMDRLNKSEAKAQSAADKADAAAIAIAANRLEIERVENDLVAHRVEVAREYVAKSTLESLETRIVDAINRLGDRLDKILQART